MEISVIVPTYKPDYYIWECLESLRIQSLDREKYEVLIVLNGEKKNYYSDIEEWIGKNKIKNFKILYTEIVGVSNARNIGIDNSRGEYIVFIDDDDYVDKHYLEELLKKNKKVGKNGIVIANYINFDEKAKIELSRTNYKLSEIEENILKKRKVFSMSCIKSIPRRVINNIRFNIKLKNGEDALFMLKISKNIKKIAMVDKEVFYYRRVRKNSANFRKKKIKEILNNEFILSREECKFLFLKEYNKKLVILKLLAVVKSILYQLRL